MTNPYIVRAAHVFYAPHYRCVCEWQVRRQRDDGTGWWDLIASYGSKAEATEAARKLEEAQS